ncbi:MAG TPA: hypothetical protein VFU21_05645 [Kofleriaceae bacterium]|nr:hypothetical protein [Kofleriaceae bacterium]
MRGPRLAMIAAALLGCGPGWKEMPHDARFQRAPAPRLHRQPQGESLSGDWWDRALSSTVLPLGRVVSPGRWLEAVGVRKQALDVNALGEVPDSTWFENRIGRAPVAPEEIERGPGSAEGPAAGPLVVVSGKLEGATPGVVVRDTDGAVWFLKFDPPAFRELSTGAEVVVQRILHYAGWPVPEMQVFELALDRLVLDPRAEHRNRYNQLERLSKDELDSLLTNLNPSRSRRIRALASRAVEGEVIGPFSYRGVRVDDPNDRIPHERRRSLRGLWVFAAWLNNTDVRRQNTLDTFVTVDARRRLGYVRHFLIDFGDSLGAAGERAKYVGEGYEGHIDWAAMGGRLVTLGLRYPYWLWVRRTPYPSVGVFESTVFDPSSWEPSYDNPAFIQATARDTFWAATLLARFDQKRVEAAVAAGRYSEPRAAALLVQILMRRRAKLLALATRRMAPLIDPEVRGTVVAMRDLEEVAGLPPAAGRRYRWSVRWNRSGHPDCELERGEGDAPRLDVGPAIRRTRLRDQSGFAGDPFLTVTFWRPRHGRSGPGVDVHLRVHGDRLVLAGLDREIE